MAVFGNAQKHLDLATRKKDGLGLTREAAGILGHIMNGDERCYELRFTSLEKDISAVCREWT